MLTQTAATLATPNAVTNVTAKQAPVQGGAGAVFAALLAKLNPQVAKPDSKTTPIALAKAAPQDTTAQDNTDASGDIAAAVAAMQTVTPTPAPVLPKTGDATAEAITDGSKPFAALKSVDPAQLRAALTAPTEPAKPGSPTLPVVSPHTDEDEGDELAAASTKDVAAKDAPSMPDVAKVVQHLLRPTTPAQTTEAQTLPVKFDAKQDGNADSGGAQTNSQQHQHGQPNTQTNTLTGQTSSTPPTQPVAHAPAPQVEVKTAETPVAPTAVAAATPVQAAQSTQTTQAALHITQAAHTAAQPDIAALAVNIAAKAQGGAKHFDIRLDPPELGRIEVHLSVDDAGKAQAHLAADKPQTLDLLQRDSSSLTKALKDSGVDLGNTGLSFSLRGQDRDGGAAPRSFARGRALGVSAVTEATPSNPTIASDSARLDIRV